MRLVVFVLLIFVGGGSVFGQLSSLDSLRNELSKVDSLEDKISLENQITSIFVPENIDSAFYHNQILFDYAKSINLRYGIAEAYMNFAAIYLECNCDSLYAITNAYIDSAFQICNEIDWQDGLAKCYNLSAYVHSQLKMYDKAVSDFISAERILYQEGNIYGCAVMNYNISEMYTLSGSYEKALNHIEDNWDLYKQINDVRFIIVVRNHIGYLHFKMGNFRKSLEVCFKLFNSYNHEIMINERIQINTLIGNSYFELNNLDSAQYYITKALDFKLEPENEDIRIDALTTQARIFDLRGAYKQAENGYLTTLKISRQYLQTIDEVELLGFLSAFYEKQNRFDLALEYFQKYKSLSDSLKLQRIDVIVDNAMTENELMDKQQKLEQLLRDKDNAIHKKLFIYGYGLSLFLIMSLLWSVLSVSHWNLIQLIHRMKSSPEKLTFWACRLPGTPFPIQYGLFMSVLYGITQYGALYITEPTLVTKVKSIIWCLAAAFIFACLTYIIGLSKRRLVTLSFKNEVVMYLTGFLVLYLSALLLKIALRVETDYLTVFFLVLGTISFMGIVQVVGLYLKRQARLKNQFYRVVVSQFNQQKVRETEKGEIETEANNDKTEIQPGLNIPGFVVVSNVGKELHLAPQNIVYIVSDNVYQEVYYLGNRGLENILIRSTMSEIEKSLEHYNSFLRCHRSYIVNFNHVIAMKGKVRQRYLLLLQEKQIRIPIGRSAEPLIMGKMQSVIELEQSVV